MSIPEVESRNRLLAFLKKYFALKGSSGGAGAPTDAQYVTLATDGDLSAERVLTQGTGQDLQLLLSWQIRQSPPALIPELILQSMHKAALLLPQMEVREET